MQNGLTIRHILKKTNANENKVKVSKTRKTLS